MVQEGRESKCHIESYRTSYITILIKAQLSLSPPSLSLAGADRRPHIPSWRFSSHTSHTVHAHRRQRYNNELQSIMNLHLSCNQALFGQPWTVSYIYLFKLSVMTSSYMPGNGTQVVVSFCILFDRLYLWSMLSLSREIDFFFVSCKLLIAAHRCTSLWINILSQCLSRQSHLKGISHISWDS